MILTLLILISFIVISNLILFWFPVKKHHFHHDLERAEEYIYSKTVFEKVFIGSGLIGDLASQIFDKSFNLFFPYYGSCTGAEIIKLSQKTPKILFVETNYVFKGINEKLTDRLSDYSLRKLKYFLPALQQKHSIYNLVKMLIGKSTLINTGEPNSIADTKNTEHLVKFIEAYNTLPELDKFEEDLNRFKTNIDVLISNGCHIIFFEIPMDPALINSKLFSFQRARIKSVFNNKVYRWIPEDVYNTYDNLDGLHLTDSSTHKYAQYFLGHYQKLMSDNRLL